MSRGDSPVSDGARRVFGMVSRRGRGRLVVSLLVWRAAPVQPQGRGRDSELGIRVQDEASAWSQLFRVAPARTEDLGANPEPVAGGVPCADTGLLLLGKFPINLCQGWAGTRRSSHFQKAGLPGGPGAPV